MAFGDQMNRLTIAQQIGARLLNVSTLSGELAGAVLVEAAKLPPQRSLEQLSAKEINQRLGRLLRSWAADPTEEAITCSDGAGDTEAA